MLAHDLLRPKSNLAAFAYWALFVGVLVSLCVWSSLRPNLAELAQESVATVETPTGWGSAVAFQVRGSERTFFLTAKHVIENRGALKIRVESHQQGFKAGHFEVPAQVVFVSSACDAAILTIPPVQWKFRGARIELDTPRVGDEVYAVGNMHGANFDRTVSQGIVAQLGVYPESFPNFPWPLVDQTTAINLPGSSGGPVFSRETGKLLGIQVGNAEGAVFLYLPSRALLAHAHREGWDWLFGYGKAPSEDKLFPKPAESPSPTNSVVAAIITSPLAPPPAVSKGVPSGLNPELKRGHR